MDHDVICDCAFAGTCQTYADPLIAESRKGPKGCGCAGQTDFYRSRHCQSFRCNYLSATLSEMLNPGAKPTG